MRRTLGGATVVATGVVVLLSAWANAPEMVGFHPACTALDPVGVHLTRSGTVSYVGGCGPYPRALPAFAVLTVAGLACVGAGVVTVRSERDRRAP